MTYPKEEPICNIFDVAKYILEKCGRMITWKLQKLCYYSQAWHLAWTGEPLFNESFEAWDNGAVCPDLFYCYRGMFDITEKEINIGNSSMLSDDEKETIDVVLKYYGTLKLYELRALTHGEELWKDAYNQKSIIS